EDYRYGNSKNALYLRLSKAQELKFKALSLYYVIVEGTVYANGPEQAEYAAALGEIGRMEKWDPRPDLPPAARERESHCSR
ncbi:MAG TPA: hypothetical protein VF786_02745, partial [Terriglobales bacterium]